MKKREAKLAWVAAQGPLFRCPLCRQPLIAVATGLECSQGHHFDVARKGTVDFLHHVTETEYSATLFTSRRAVLTAGFFDPIVAAIGSQLTPHDRFLDIGCGEGTPTAKLADSGAAAVGFDIAPAGIHLAGTLATSAFFCVADLAQLPFEDQTFTAIVDLFSPGNYEEFDRVLMPAGRIYKVVPRADYLLELRQGLYAGTARATYDNQRVVQHFYGHYPEATRQEIVYNFVMTPALFQELMAMTPLAWQAPEDQKARLLADPPTTMRVAVDLLTAQTVSEPR